MTKDIIKLSATLLGLDDVVNYLSSPEEQPSEIVSTKINELIVITNYCLRQIVKEYFSLNHKEIVCSDSNCQIEYKNLSKTPISILDIKNNANLSVTFNLYPEFIKVGTPNSNYLISYNWLPNNIESINQEITLPFGLDYYILCYGVASEYSLSKLLYSEAEMWESKFKNALSSLKNLKGERRFFARRLK